MFLGKSVLKICSKLTAEHPCRTKISIKLLVTLLKSHFGIGISPVNLSHIFRTPFSRNTSEWLLLKLIGFCYGNLQKETQVITSDNK